MFAGPNGSGKSTLKSMLRPELIGIYINPDEIEDRPLSHKSPSDKTAFLLTLAHIYCSNFFRSRLF